MKLLRIALVVFLAGFISILTLNIVQKYETGGFFVSIKEPKSVQSQEELKELNKQPTTQSNIKVQYKSVASTNEASMIALTNNYRTSKGLNRLSENGILMSTAQRKADILCSTGEWSHDAGGEKFWVDLKRQGYMYAWSGENLAKNFTKVDNAFTALLNSPTHHENIVGEFNDIGVGHSYCEGKNYYGIHYGRL